MLDFHQMAAAAQTAPSYLKVDEVSGSVVNNVINVDAQTGSDLGAQINTAVASCSPGPCSYEIHATGGTISTAPNLPAGSYLRFAPNGNYTISTHWVIAHRNVIIDFNGAHLTYSLNDGQTAFYVGKDISPVVSLAANSTTVTWVSGPNFSTVDLGDQIGVDSGTNNPAQGNVCAVVSTTQLTLCKAISTTALTSRSAVFATYAYAASNGDRGDVIKNVSLIDGVGTAANIALVVELASLTTYGFQAQNFANGTCLNILGAISGNYFDTHCNLDKYNVVISENSIGGFFNSTGNANKFFGIGITSCTAAGGTGITISGNSQNTFYGLHEEGCLAHVVNTVQQAAETGYPSTIFQSAGNQFYITDVERNGDNTAGSTEFSLLNNTDTTLITGGSFTSVYSGAGSGIGTQYGVTAASTTTEPTLPTRIFSAATPTAITFRPAPNVWFQILSLWERTPVADIFCSRTAQSIPV